ncbi:MULTISPECIES: glycosyltransferase family 4 protein [unclassified Haloarcula]|uniref:glycosyltransferase family 4 protein n=1 Tax=Haloarcula TaxID=2237 RepID=UPI000EF14864|nr:MULTISPECIES: glycosyltransferase family 4 protein [unclassified Haloarcula]RLM34606.1 glycosyltransferase WbuB [Haloarcula sp. Atlit-120R]RLM44020.1 glycosyltransferase WbuB [Haloarcula sp. Atlit-47R]RLM95065.1 glycosyltransferase WbuB [Haloarcula sp. Atlit-7R]
MTTDCVIVSQRYPPEKGGNASRIHDTAVNLGDDFDVTVLAPCLCYPPGNFERTWKRKQTDRDKGVVVHRLWTWQPQRENPSLLRRLPYYLIFALHAALWLVLNFRQYDVVMTSTPPISTGFPGLVAAAIGTPWVIDVRDLWIENSIALGYISADSPLVTAGRAFQRLALHSADCITVTTETLGEAVADTYGSELRDRVQVVPNGVDITRFSSVSSPENGGSRIVYTGNIGSAQALEPCIRAMQHISSDDAVLQLVGDGDEVSRLKDVTDRLGLEDRVEFVGLVDRERIPEILDTATIGLAPIKDSPELDYAIPTKLYEYMACSLPVVVTGRGEIKRFATDTEAGIHTEPTPESIGAAIDSLLENPDKRVAMGRDGHRVVSESYDRQAIAGRLGEVFRTLTTGEQLESYTAPEPEHD